MPWTVPEWIYVDLGAIYNITRVLLNWETAYANGYQVQVSANASSWTNIFSTTTGNGGIDDLTGLSGSGRYVRMNATSRGSTYGFSLFEFEVYGTPAGLKGEYFNNTSLTAPVVLTRTDATVNFDWGSSSPGTGVNTNNFSTRWTGQVQAPVSGSYTFSAVSDNGVRLWVNNIQVINNWTSHTSTQDNGTPITLTASQKYDIRMEYYDGTGTAIAKLQWAYPGQAQQIIPTSRLNLPAPAPAIALTVNKSSLKQIIDGFGFFGGRDSWWQSSDPSYFYTDAWLNLILSDLGITMWRNEIFPHNPPTTNTTANQDAYWDKQKPLVQALKAKAVALGVDLKTILTVWTPPGAFKWESSFAWPGDVNATRGPGAQGDYHSEKNGGTLNPNKFSQFATWLSQAIQMYKDAGVTPFALSPQNEPAFSQDFNSCTYTTFWYRDMMKAVIPTVKTAHPGLKIFGTENMLEMEGAEENYPYFYHMTLKNDATAMALIDRISVHGYTNGVNPSSGSTLAQYWTRHKNEFSTPLNKPSWMTETSGYVDTWESSGGSPGAFNLALDMHAALFYGDVSGWLWWSGSGDPSSTDPIGVFQLMHGTTVGKKYNASKQFYRYIRPGARRMETSSPDSNLYVSAYYHAANNKHTVVILNTASTSKVISISGSNLPAAYDMYTTSATQNNQLTTNVSSTNLTIPARSVVTLQAGGTPLGGSGSARTAMATNTIQPKADRVSIYPNPVNSSMLTVEIFADKIEEATFTLMNASSQRITEIKRSLVNGRNVISIPVKPGAKGMYFIRIKNDASETVKKVIFQ